MDASGESRRKISGRRRGGRDGGRRWRSWLPEDPVSLFVGRLAGFRVPASYRNKLRNPYSDPRPAGESAPLSPLMRRPASPRAAGGTGSRPQGLRPHRHPLYQRSDRRPGDPSFRRAAGVLRYRRGAGGGLPHSVRPPSRFGGVRFDHLGGDPPLFSGSAPFVERTSLSPAPSRQPPEQPPSGAGRRKRWPSGFPT